ncbi:ABC transporter permease [Streptomyces sp. NRRL B-1677]|uniref:ABC transporter permease n=1 Tax=Streptomyces klenkii TaxID=1420899 RepID=A0A3B0BVG7_9ACTN|nr:MULTISPECIES: ABC transporter permease [Streptomyces]MBF6045906.1 ABC transporter permease [Streptomyces sp. NRRL B-1677]RKN76431.1 ABC transporter permease [Streptomyces klenkii]
MTTPQPQAAHPAAPQTAPQAPPHAAPGYWPGTAPAGGPAGPVGYVSPIPVRKATLMDAVSAEWTKIRSVRSTIWTLSVMVAIIVGIGLLIAAGVDASGSKMTGSTALAGGFFSVMLGMICVLTLGVLTISSEYGTGMIRTTLTACPDRVRVLTAKAIVFFALTFAITLVSTALVAMFDVAMLEDQAEFAASGGEWLKVTVGTSLFVGLLGIISLAVGTLLRHSAGAITVMLGLVLAPLVVAMFMYTESLSSVRKALFEYSIPMLLSVFYGASGESSATSLSGWDPLWVIAIAAAVALGGAYASLLKRDA